MDASKKILRRIPIVGMINAIIGINLLRRLALELVERKIYKRVVEVNQNHCPRRSQEDKYYIVTNMLRSFIRAWKEGLISPRIRKHLIEELGGRVLIPAAEKVERFRREHGFNPPKFVTISPYSGCNLRCAGCYAISSSEKAESLSYHIADRILREKTEQWGSHFTVISGGEPLLWRSQGKGILDLAASHQDNFFLMYTNGTLITPKVVERMAEVANITPAVSVEGLKRETDARRGRGVYEKILQAFQNLREAGVPFGVSVTVTRENAEVVTSDEFFELYFKEQGALYSWFFQYMPIGRSYTLELMVTPEQRLDVYRRVQRLVREKRYFMADFWNNGPLSNGCISAGRPDGGYFYINWKGDVTPCVFVPYSTHNIQQVYQQGGDLNTILYSPFFSSIRKWQYAYGFMKPPTEVGNQITPCPMRDHYRVIRGIIDHHQAHPIDEAAATALTDKGYYEGMLDYGERVRGLTRDIWEKEYLSPEREALQEGRKPFRGGRPAQ